MWMMMCISYGSQMKAHNVALLLWVVAFTWRSSTNCWLRLCRTCFCTFCVYARVPQHLVECIVLIFYYCPTSIREDISASLEVATNVKFWCCVRTGWLQNAYLVHWFCFINLTNPVFLRFHEVVILLAFPFGVPQICLGNGRARDVLKVSVFDSTCTSSGLHKKQLHTQQFKL